MNRQDIEILNEFIDLLKKQNNFIGVLAKENLELKRQNTQLEEICKMHARAVDFYIKKLDEAEKQLRQAKRHTDINIH